jgi:hypothetical protein
VSHELRYVALLKLGDPAGPCELGEKQVAGLILVR